MKSALKSIEIRNHEEAIDATRIFVKTLRHLYIMHHLLYKKAKSSKISIYANIKKKICKKTTYLDDTDTYSRR